MSKHTPGPWLIGKRSSGGYSLINADGWESLARVVTVMEDDNRPCAEGVANARLIAAAPDLLEALKELSRSFIGTYSDDQRSDDEINNHREHWERMARAAIAKATGEQA